MTFVREIRTRPSAVFGVALILLLMALCFAPSARADAIYSYTGSPLTTFSGNDSCTNGVGECSLSGTITFTSPLPPNSVFSFSEYFGALDFGGQSLPPNLLSFSLTDGVQTFNNTSSGRYGSAEFGITLDTGSNGQIVNWSFFIAADPETGMGTGGPGNGFGPGGLAGGDLTTNYGGGKASNSGTPGTWTETTTPEPSTLLLLGTGLGMVGAWRRKKPRQNRRDDLQP